MLLRKVRSMRVCDKKTDTHKEFNKILEQNSIAISLYEQTNAQSA